MANTKLCKLCQTIPFESLPRFSDHFHSGCFALNDDLIPISPKKLHSGRKKMGFAHHKGLDALRQSAKRGCPLCSLVHEAAKRFQTALDQPLDGESPFSNRSKMAWIRPTDYQLQIVRLGPEDNGLVVFADTNDPRSAYVIAVLHLGVKDNSDLAAVFAGRKIYDKTELQPETVRLLQSWLSACHCVKNVSRLPTRVLDVGKGEGAASPTIRLWETGGAKAPYVTLSHCWGKVVAFTTTRATLAERKAGITVAAMPKSFRDAVTITRALGLRYLWIDSLCILQQDAEDWEAEGLIMEDIYANAHLTVALASAADDDTGCLHAAPQAPRYAAFRYQTSTKRALFARTPRQTLSGTVFASLAPPGRAVDYPKRMQLTKEPLSARAWTFQERTLSPRSVFFGRDQMHFECRHHFRSEDGFAEARQYVSLDTIAQQAKSAPSAGSAPDPTASLDKDQQLTLSWFDDIVTPYSVRHLTYDTDRLTALAGLTKRFSRLYRLRGNDYVAGLWRRGLVGGLLWAITDFHGVWRPAWPPAPADYHAPSWSWASSTGRVTSTAEWQTARQLASVVGVDSSLSSANPFGRVQHAAVLLLRAPQVALRVDKSQGQHNIFFGFTTADGRHKLKVTSYIDTQCTNALLASLRVFAVVFGHYVGYNGAAMYTGLLVTPCRDDSGHYRRLGFAVFEGGLGDKMPKAGGKFPVLALV